jgi:hypothetical protein
MMAVEILNPDTTLVSMGFLNPLTENTISELALI